MATKANQFRFSPGLISDELTVERMESLRRGVIAAAPAPTGHRGVKIRQTPEGWTAEAALTGGASASKRGTFVIYKTGADKFKITWGVVELKIPTAILDEITLSGDDGDRYVWLEITMQTVSPYSVVSATVEHDLVAGYPDPLTPDPTPPPTVYFPLGVVGFVSGAITTIFNTNGTFGGSVGVSLVQSGSSCAAPVAADPGDPEADPVVPATPAEDGGIVGTFNWATYRK